MTQKVHVTPNMWGKCLTLQINDVQNLAQMQKYHYEDNARRTSAPFGQTC